MGVTRVSKVYRIPSRQGFTIIELLVVVIVIGILAAAGLSKYQSFAEVARARTCTSNQSTIETSIGIFTTSKQPLCQTCEGFGDFWSGRGHFHTGWGSATSFHNTDEIGKVVGDNKAFLCPSFKRWLEQNRENSQYLQTALDSVCRDCRYGCNGADPTGSYMFYYNGQGVGGSWNGSTTHWYDDAGAQVGHQIVWCGKSGSFNCPGSDGSYRNRHSNKW